MRKIKVLLWSAGGSFAFELFKVSDPCPRAHSSPN